MKNLKYYLQKAQKEGWAVGQFNFSTLEQLKGILIAAGELKSPVILGTSEGESRFVGIEEAVALVKVFRQKIHPALFLNLDHGRDLSYLKMVANLGYAAVHFDGSDLDFKENIRLTREIADYCRRKGVLIEGEIGTVKGSSELHPEEAVISGTDLTQPEEAEKFVRETKSDSLAIAIGNIHGIYETMPGLDYGRLKEIRKRVKAFLVFHGGSGFLPAAIKAVINCGVVKVNINTELRTAWKSAIEMGLTLQREVKPYKILAEVPAAIQKIVAEKINIFGSANKI